MRRYSESGHLEVGRLARRNVLQDRLAARLDEPQPATHQRDVGVDVHRLVGLVRERRVPLALERGDLGAEDPQQAAAQLLHACARRHLALADRPPKCGVGETQVAREAAEHLLDEELAHVVVHLLGLPHRLEPFGGVGVVVGEGPQLAEARLAAARVLRERRLQVRVGFGQRRLDLGGERARRLEALELGLVARVRRVVDQQHDALGGELLERGRPQRAAHHLRSSA